MDGHVQSIRRRFAPERARRRHRGRRQRSRGVTARSRAASAPPDDADQDGVERETEEGWRRRKRSGRESPRRAFSSENRKRKQWRQRTVSRTTEESTCRVLCRSLVRSFIRSLRTACFVARSAALKRLLAPLSHSLALHCLHASRRSIVCSHFARSLSHSQAHGKKFFVHNVNASISCSFNPLCSGEGGGASFRNQASIDGPPVRLMSAVSLDDHRSSSSSSSFSSSRDDDLDGGDDGGGEGGNDSATTGDWGPLKKPLAAGKGEKMTTTMTTKAAATTTMMPRNKAELVVCPLGGPLCDTSASSAGKSGRKERAEAEYRQSS